MPEDRAVRTTPVQLSPALVHIGRLGAGKGPGPELGVNHDPLTPHRCQKGLGREGKTGPRTRTSGPAPTTPRRQSRQQPSVHRADINDPAIEAPGEDR